LKHGLPIFKATTDELFEGEKAFMAKERATSIATVMQIKIAQLKTSAHLLLIRAAYKQLLPYGYSS
jgi:hypothetical protein